jgi:outer membrane protein assembly factor BamE (lipoprotein component of BamABCDE complex)
MKKLVLLGVGLALVAMVASCKTHVYYPETSETVSEGVVVSEDTVVE